ncbi:MAG TPA: hypothetical protein VFL85_02915 [Candidatus Saccharimonadales bacterium]|nr:hypothetical protein [Candidatus Saccharimonadales bacterium]
MHTYEAVMLGIKVLIIIYLVVTPWTLGPWVWVPGFTGMMAVVVFLTELCSKPTPHGSMQAMHAANEQWADSLVLKLCYVVYYIVAVLTTLWLQNKWLDHAERKERRARRSRQRVDTCQEWKVVPNQTPSPRPHAIVRKPLALPPGRPKKDGDRT